MLKISDKTRASIERYRDNNEYTEAVQAERDAAANVNRTRQELIAIESKIENLEAEKERQIQAAAEKKMGA